MAVLLVLSTFAAASCETKPREVYEIPAAHKGWVEIRAKRADCPPALRNQNEVRFILRPDGTMCTSSPIEFGWGREDFYYVKDGKRIRLVDSGDSPDKMIWQKEYFGGNGVGPAFEADRDRIRFFVGTKAEYEKSQMQN